MDTERRFQLLYFVHFVSFSGFAAFRNVYLADLGLSAVEMGAVGSLFVASGVLAQPVWGTIADATGSPAAVMTAAAVCSGFAVLLFPLGGVVSATFLVVAAGSVAFAATRAPVVPIANSLVLERGFDYGQIRSFGSLAFGAGVLAVGFAVSAASTSVIVGLYVVGTAIFVALAVASPSEGAAFDGDLGAVALGLVRRPRFAVVLVVAFLVGAASSSGAAFFSVYMRAVGLGDSLTGVAWAAKTAAETVVFFGAAGLGASYGRKLGGGGLLYVAAFLAFALTGSVLPVVAANLLLGAGYALVHYSLANLAHERSPEGLRSTAQTAVTGIGLGAGGTVGQAATGYAVETVGVQQSYAYLAAVAGLVVLASAFVDRPLSASVR